MKTSSSLLILFCLFSLTLHAAPAVKPKPQPPVAPKSFEERLFLDWLVQDSNRNTNAYFKSKNENAIESELVARVLNSLDPEARTPFQQASRALTSAKVPGSDPRWRELYTKACQARRLERLTLVSEFSPTWIYTKHYVIGASFYAYTEDASDEEYKDISADRRNGGQLCQMQIMPDGKIRHEVLYETPEGTIRDPDVSWDGSRILFSMRRHFENDDFHLYEYDVKTKKIRQLTFGPGFADIEPVYLPNDDILFTSTRCVQITDCWWTEVSNFYTMDSHGRRMQRVSFDQVSVNYPKVLNDGRVIYTRWDYNDRGQVFPQPLFVMNSDATGQTEYYGNNSWFPTSILHARAIPDSSKVIAIAAGHHTYQHGKLLLIDRAKGNQENLGCSLIAPVRETPAVRVDAYGQGGELFQYPYALDESNFLVSYLPEGRWYRSYPIPFGVYYMDIDGKRELLAYDPTISCNQQVPLMPRVKPPVRASQVDQTRTTGDFYVQNVYEGPGLKGVPKGTVKSLRVVALGFRTAGIQKNRNKGPAGAAMISTPVSVDNGAWDTKHILGTVPVEEDGSAYFRVPAHTPVYFQMLDAKGDTIQTMRSWSTLQPGELFACVGCHEPKENTMTNPGTTTTQALRKPPVELRPGPFPEGIFQDGFSFVREIQPILDKHCVRCHTGQSKEDGTKEPFSLRGDTYISPKKPGGEPVITGGRHFSRAYLNLTQFGKQNNQYIHWLDVQEGPALLPPYYAGATLSPMIKMFRAGGDANHRDVRLSEKELQKIATWIDLLVPFCGDYREASDWTPHEQAVYAYYEMKKSEMNRIISENMKRMEKGRRAGKLPEPEELEQFCSGGVAFKQKFLADYAARSLPVLGRKSGKENVYRNLALNKTDCQGDAQSYPHAHANSELRYLAVNAAKNVIDGVKPGESSDAKSKATVPAWRPNLRSDLKLTIEFGYEVETDRVVLSLHGDMKQFPRMQRAVLIFTDGSEVPIELKPTEAPQTFTFAKRRTQYVTLTRVEYTPWPPNAPTDLVWPGITEFEVWGTSVTP